MEDSFQDIKSTLEDVQTTTTYILERVNELADSDGSVCTCACHSPGADKKGSMDNFQCIYCHCVYPYTGYWCQRVERISRSLCSAFVIQEIQDLKERMKRIEDIVCGGSNSDKHVHGVSPKTNEGEMSPIRTTGMMSPPGDDRQVLSTRTTRQKPRANVHPLADVHKTTVTTEKQASEKAENDMQSSSIHAGGQTDKATEKARQGAKETRAPLSMPDSTALVKKTSGIAVPHIQAISEPHREMSSNQSSAQDVDAEVLKQTEPRFHSKIADWATLAQMELDSGKATELERLEGAHTAILLDISESMAKPDAWSQTKTFLDNFIDGLLNVSKEPGFTDEHVSFVTFGHDTRVVCRLTNQYEEIRKAYGSVRLGGPSPLYGGLYMALASIMHSKQHHATVNDIRINSRVIVISDGHITKTVQQAGPDTTDDSQEEDRKHLASQLSQFQDRGIDICTVPVGDSNKHVMELMAAGNGRLWSWEEGVKLSRRTYLTIAAGPGLMLSLLGLEFDPNFKSNVPLSDSDRLQMLDIVSEAKRRHFNELSRRMRGEDDPYLDTENERLLTVGTRVRRGPDLDPERDEDGNGPGTVVGHWRYVDKVWVQWDVGEKIFHYRYGEGNGYDVLAVDEVRELKNGHLVVGCPVKPSKDATVAHSELKPFDRGVVILTNPKEFKIGVKWKSGISGEYDYIHGIRQEVEFCPTSDVNAPTITTEETKKSRVKKNKNNN